MAAPWLPSIPADFPPFVADLVDLATALVPKRLYRRGADAYLELQAWGEGLAYFRQMLEFILRSYAAQNDSNALLLNRWEETFALEEAPSLAARQAAIQAAARTRGTGTEALIQSIFAPLFGLGDSPGDIAFASGDVSLLPEATPERQKATVAFSMLIYDGTEANHVDRVRADKILREVTPAGDRWFVNRFRVFTWGKEGAGWGSVWSS